MQQAGFGGEQAQCTWGLVSRAAVLVIFEILPSCFIWAPAMFASIVRSVGRSGSFWGHVEASIVTSVEGMKEVLKSDSCNISVPQLFSTLP